MAGLRAVPGSGRERFGIPSASGAAEEDAHAPASVGDGLAGGDSGGVRRGARGLWMAPRVAATEGRRRARGQAPGADRDAAERHPGAWQAAFSRFDYGQQPCSAHCAEPAGAQLHRGRGRTPSGPAT